MRIGPIIMRLKTLCATVVALTWAAPAVASGAPATGLKGASWLLAFVGFGMVAFGAVAALLALNSIFRSSGRAPSRVPVSALVPRSAQAMAQAQALAYAQTYGVDATQPQQNTLRLEPPPTRTAAPLAEGRRYPDATVPMDALALGALEATVQVTVVDASQAMSTLRLPPPPPAGAEPKPEQEPSASQADAPKLCLQIDNCPTLYSPPPDMDDVCLPNAMLPFMERLNKQLATPTPGPDAPDSIPPVPAVVLPPAQRVRALPPPVPPADANAPTPVMPIHRRRMKAQLASRPSSADSSGSLPKSDSGVVRTDGPGPAFEAMAAFACEDFAGARRT
jgi:hypothetical protein